MTDKKFKRFCEIARKVAAVSDERYKVVAIVYNKNKVISTGVNTSKKSNPLIKRYFLHATLHAEIAALIPILHYDNLSNLNIFVYRDGKSDGKRDGKSDCENKINLRNSKPCAMCVKALYDTGWFKNVYWTIDNGNVDNGYNHARIDDLKDDVMKISHNLRYFYNGKQLTEKQKMRQGIRQGIRQGKQGVRNGIH